MKHAKNAPEAEEDDIHIQESLDMIAPSAIKFETDYFIYGNIYRYVQVLRECPASTEEQAILKRLGGKDGITLKICTRRVNAVEERRIISNAASKNQLNQSSTNDLQQTVQAESNPQDMAMIVARTHQSREPLLHMAAYMELTVNEYDRLKLLQTEVMTKLIHSKLNVNRLLLRRQQGLRRVMPSERSVFRDQFERVLPASNIANLYPSNYNGKTNSHGFRVSRDKFGSNILVDLNQRAGDKTNGSIPILGNGGQGKSYLLKPILCNLWEVGLSTICLDPETGYEELTNNLGGCLVNLIGSRLLINPLESKIWDEGEGPENLDAPETFWIRNRISQHISSLKDFFCSYEDLTDRGVDVIEITVQRPCAKCGLTGETDFQRLGSKDYPTLPELYGFIGAECKGVGSGEQQLCTVELLQNTLLGLHSTYRGPEAKFFNGHINTTNSSLVIFGVKRVLQVSRNLCDVSLFNTLSFVSNQLLVVGDTMAELDEFYLFPSSLTAIEYIRNFMKRVRKRNSSVILANQNSEGFDIEGTWEYAKPLSSIPTHQFLFNVGTVDEKFYTDAPRLEASELNLTRHPQRGVRLYKYGDEYYSLMVTVLDYKAKLSGKAGG